MRGAFSYLVGLIALAALAGCQTSFFESREPWRHEAEAQCLKGGAVRESAAVQLLKPIQGPGMCGADFPLKVAALGDSSALGYGDELRPPGAIPQMPRGFPPLASPRYSPMPNSPMPAGPSPRVYESSAEEPISLLPPNATSAGANAAGYYPPTPDYDSDSSSARRSSPYEPPERRPPYRDRPMLEAPQTAQPMESPHLLPERVPLGPTRGQALVQTTAAVMPVATLACPIVSTLDRWIVEAVQPAAQRWFNQPVTEIRQISAYSCRGMNGQPGARISEHAFGNALDIAAFVLADGQKITVKGGWRGAPEEQGFLRDVQAAACEMFSTVLAPGSNAYHYDHIHVDLMRRSSGRRICQPGAVSGEEVAARATQRGLMQVRSRDHGATGSIAVRRQDRPRADHWMGAVDDEEALVD